MKNQYFGDVNDYRKYGLLRSLQSPGFSLSVGWMLTPDDGGPDGGFRRYLLEPERWRRHDPELFDHLSVALTSAQGPNVDMIESSTALPGCRFFSEHVPDGRVARVAWSSRMTAACTGRDLVFLDPDNGIEVPSKPVGRRGSSKYALWSEIEALWSGGSSVLIYQHYRRENRRNFTSRIADELRSRTSAPFVEGFATPHVLFLLAAQPAHVAGFRAAMAGPLQAWRGQVMQVGLSAD